MGVVLKRAEHLAAEVHRIDIQLRRGIAVDEAVDQGLEEGALSAGDAADHDQMALFREIDDQRILHLVLRVVHEAHGRGEAEAVSVRGPRPVPERVLGVARQRRQVKLLRQQRHPELLPVDEAVLLRRLGEILHHGVQLRLFHALGQLFPQRLKPLDDVLGDLRLVGKSGGPELDHFLQPPQVGRALRVLDLLRVQVFHRVLCQQSAPVPVGPGERQGDVRASGGA